jgi:hypothetical protein
MSNVCVVIPVHNSFPSEAELISFKQCFNVLCDFDIVVLTSATVDLCVYKKVRKFETKIVPSTWISSIENYNKMKIDIEFYRIFSDYEFLLTYELDAFVFENQLNNWLFKGYDYIGAPFVELIEGKLVLISVGNSGFSLRNIQACLNCLSQLRNVRNTASLVAKYRGHKLVKFLAYFEKYFPNRFFSKIRIISALLPGICVHEDIFWTKYIPRLFPNYKVAPLHESLGFSFERHPELCFEKNDFKLPFGCHAWQRYGYNFWKQWIIK